MPMSTPMIPDFKGKPATFLKEVKSELKKVIWPSKNEVVKLTIVIIIVSTIMGVYIGGLDFLFTKLMNLLVKS